MSVTDEKTKHGFVRLNVDGTEVLGVRISGHKRSMAGQLQGLRRGKGSVVHDGKIDDWQIRGLIEHEGGIYAYGDERAHATLPELLSGEVSSAINTLHELATALATLSAGGLELPSFQPNLLLRFDGEGFLILPKELIDTILSAQTEAERLASYDPFNHPDLAGERNASFLLGVLAYRLLTGRAPYSAENTEELHERIREAKVLPPKLAVPELKEELSDLISRSFKAEEQVTLEEWQQQLSTCAEDGYLREVSDAERARLEEAAERFSKSSEAGFRRQVFFRKNWKTMLIVAGVVVIVGAVGGSILKNALKPRITVGMAPEQVVHLYYTSMNTFNSQAMQDCVIDGAGKAAINEATNLYVISRVRTGYEGSSGYVQAQKWLNEGKPKLPPGSSVYGVADLKITQDTPSSFTVSYQKWQPVQVNNPPNASSNAPVILKVQGWQRQDKLYLKHESNFWAIYRIDHLVTQQLGKPIPITNPNESARRPAIPAQTPQ